MGVERLLERRRLAGKSHIASKMPAGRRRSKSRRAPTCTTTATGDYSVPLNEIGEYSVTVVAPGFNLQEKRGIVVQLQQRARVNFQLAVGDTKETVEVVASTVQLKTEDATVGQVIDNRRAVELPRLQHVWLHRSRQHRSRLRRRPAASVLGPLCAGNAGRKHGPRHTRACAAR